VPQCPQDHFLMCGSHATGFKQSGHPKNDICPFFIGPQLDFVAHVLQYQPLTWGWNQTGLPHSEQARYSIPGAMARLRLLRTAAYEPDTATTTIIPIMNGFIIMMSAPTGTFIETVIIGNACVNLASIMSPDEVVARPLGGSDWYTVSAGVKSESGTVRSTFSS